MLSIGWSSRAIGDLSRIESYWLQQNPAVLRSVLYAILARATWIGQDHALLGSPVRELPMTHRWQLERTYGYNVYHRVHGAPAHEHHDHNHTSWPAETARSRNNPPSLRIKPGESLDAGDILQSHWR